MDLFPEQGSSVVKYQLLQSRSQRCVLKDWACSFGLSLPSNLPLFQYLIIYEVRLMFLRLFWCVTCLLPNLQRSLDQVCSRPSKICPRSLFLTSFSITLTYNLAGLHLLFSSLDGIALFPPSPTFPFNLYSTCLVRGLRFYPRLVWCVTSVKLFFLLELPLSYTWERERERNWIGRLIYTDPVKFIIVWVNISLSFVAIEPRAFFTFVFL